MTLFHMVDSRIHNLIDNNPDTYVSNLTDRIVLFRQLSVLFLIDWYLVLLRVNPYSLVYRPSCSHSTY